MAHLKSESYLLYNDVAPQEVAPLLTNATLIFGEKMSISVKGTFLDGEGHTISCTRFEAVDRQQVASHLADSLFLLPIEYRSGRADLWLFPHGIETLRIGGGHDQ